MKKLLTLLLCLQVTYLISHAQISTIPTTIKPTGTLTVTTRDTSFVPPTVGPFAPQKLMGGDREFGGHGPEIWASIKLSIINKKSIEAEVYMHARETTSDWSETEGKWKKIIFTAPAGTEIVSIESGKSSDVHYISKPGPNAFSPVGITEAVGGARGENVTAKDDGLVARWNIVGDTGGDDISTDANPHDDTSVTVQLNPVKLKIRSVAKPAVKTNISGAASRISETGTSK